jgi:hypothetical protein
MPEETQNPIFGAAILKLTFALKNKADEPGFRVVYYGTLRELGLTDSQVTLYIQEHRETLEAHIRAYNDKD